MFVLLDWAAAAATAAAADKTISAAAITGPAATTYQAISRLA